MTWMKALVGVWNFRAFPDIVDALVQRTGLSLSKKSCRAGLHKKTTILTRHLVHPSTEKMLLPPRASTTVASFLSVMLPHPLPLRVLFFNQRKFRLFPHHLSSQCFCRHFHQPFHSWQLCTPKTELSSDPHVEGSYLHTNFHLQPLKPTIMQDPEHIWSLKSIRGLPFS